MEPIQLGRGDAEFIRTVEAESHQTMKKCYQCGKCTAGCPMSFKYDLTVSQLMRLIQLGEKDKVLSSRSISMCATCETCTTRCPNDIDVARVLDVCRNMARREGYSGVKGMRQFADSLLQTVRWFGRSHELGIMGLFKMRSRKLFSDVELAPSMLLKNKLPIMPHRIKGRSEVAAIFKRFDEQQLYKLQCGDKAKPAAPEAKEENHG